MTSGAIYEIIDGYTREAGVRNLERTITSVLRKCAQKMPQARPKKISVSGTMVKSLLGPEKVKSTFISRTDSVGIANSLAWTSVGGGCCPSKWRSSPTAPARLYRRQPSGRRDAAKALSLPSPMPESMPRR